MFLLNYVTECSVAQIPRELAVIVSTIVNLIKIVVPILLVIFGMLDLGKAVMAQKEDEIKKGQQTFLKRVIAAAIVFFVIFVTQLVFNIVAGNDSQSMWQCVNAFLSGPR